MEYYLVSPLRVTRASGSSLTYHGPTGLVPGSIVETPVGTHTVAGVVLKQIEKPSFETKALGELLESAPLPPQLIQLHAWIAQYYAAHDVNTWQTLLPRGLGQLTRPPLTTSKT